MRIDIIHILLYYISERNLICQNDLEKWKKKSLMMDGYLKVRRALTDIMSIRPNQERSRFLFIAKS